MRIKNLYISLMALLFLVLTGCGAASGLSAGKDFVPTPTPRFTVQSEPTSTPTPTRDPEQEVNKQPRTPSVTALEPTDIDTPTPEPTLIGPPSLSEIIRNVRPSVVKIETPSGNGSGTIITAEGHVLTAAHVVGSYNRVEVLIGDTRTVTGRVVGRDEERDLAIVKIIGNSLPHLEVTSYKPEVGEEIYILGYPLGLPGEATLTRGLVSAIRVLEGQEFIQTDAAINPGNSGGPALNSNGQLIAMVTSKVTDREGRGEGLGLLVGLFSVSSDVLELVR